MATIAELLKKLKDGTATQEDLQEYAVLLGRESGSQVAEAILESGIDGEELYQLSTQQLHGDYLKISDFADTLQNASYEAEGLGLRAIRPEFNKQDVREALGEIAKTANVTEEFITRQIALVSQKVADRHLQVNAEAADNAGLQVMVSRQYVSGSFGEHTTSKHPKACGFCEPLSTNGEKIPYKKAYANGIFMRHPNCRCIITYTNTAGETTVQAKKGGKESWVSEDEYNKRLNYNTESNDSELERIKRKAFSDGKKYADTLEYRERHKKGYSRISDASYIEIGGVKKSVDGISIVLDYDDDEKEGAELLVRTFGGSIIMMPKVRWPQKKRMPDYIFDGMMVDRKGPKGGGKRTIKNNIMAAKGQAEGVLLDITKCSLAEDEIMIQIERALGSSDCDFLKELYVAKDGIIIRRLERI